MALYALQDVSDAVGVTREFLTPLDVRRWLRLAVIVLFVGGNSFSTSVNVGGLPDRVPSDVPALQFGRMLSLVAAAILAVLLLGLLYGLVSAIMEFVFVESLRSGDVTIRRYWRERWRQGLRLFGFRIAVAFPLLLLGIGVLALFVLHGMTNAGFAPLLGLLVFFPLLAIVGLLVGLLNGLTTTLVVPIMVNEDCGVFDGWRRLWASFRTDWKQYAAYVIVQFVLSMALGLAVAIVLSLIAILVLIPIALLGYLVYSAVSLTSPIGLVGLGVLGGTFGLTMLAVAAIVQVPVQTYLQYYALLILGDVEPSQDLIPERREAVRAE